MSVKESKSHPVTSDPKGLNAVGGDEDLLIGQSVNQCICFSTYERQPQSKIKLVQGRHNSYPENRHEIENVYAHTVTSDDVNCWTR